MIRKSAVCVGYCEFGEGVGFTAGVFVVLAGVAAFVVDVVAALACVEDVVCLTCAAVVVFADVACLVVAAPCDTAPFVQRYAVGS